MKRFGWMLICLSALFTACDNNDNPDQPTQEQITDLSEEELANCYIVQKEGKYKFAADNQFNLGEGLPVPPMISPQKAALLWQTEPGLIKDVNLNFYNDKPFVSFEVNKAEGNAVIAVYDNNDQVVWSWHIWMPSEEVSSVKSSSGYEVMSLNLGALNNTPGDAFSYGMLYQWGRKDPFPAAATLTGNTTTTGAPLYDIEGNSVTITNSDWTYAGNNTIAYSISHPTVCLSNYAQYASSRDWLKASDSNDALWGNPEGYYRNESENSYPNKGRKTCYDPSPAGWRVAPADVFRHFTTSGGYSWIYEDFNVEDINGDGKIDENDYRYGWNFMIDDKTSLYFPAAARFDGSYAMLMGSVSGVWGNYWSNSPYPGINGGALSVLAFQVKDQAGNSMVTVSPSAAASRADAFSVRCVRDN